MPPNTTFRAATSSDGDILNAFSEIAEELEQDPRDVRIAVNVMNGYAFNPESTLFQMQKQPFVQHANQQGGTCWDSVDVTLDQLKLSLGLRRDRESGDDVISFSFIEDPSDPVDIGRSLIAVQKQFIPLNRAAALERALGPVMAEFYRLREEGLSRLEALTQRIVKETHDYRLQLDAEVAEHKKALSASFDEKDQSLEERHAERTAELKAREEELDKQRQELDDRSARHARREQSRSLQQKISKRSERFALTPETQRKRWSIHAIFVVLLLASGGLIARSLFVPPIATEGVAVWLEFGRLPLGLFGFALTAIYYIRWNDHWFRQHADQEFKLQQLALDVDRAGYATEMLLEWQEDKGGEMPSVMVDRLTAGLFMDQSTAGRAQHPSEDAIGVLLKAASNVRVNLPGVGEVTLTGRNVRRLERELNKKQDE